MAKPGFRAGLRAGLIILLFIVSAGPLRAAGDPPDPSDLKQSWWDYFVPTEESEPGMLAEHVEIATRQLAELRGQFDNTDQPTLSALTDTVISSLERYRKLSSEPLPATPVKRPAQDSYTLSEIRQLIEELRKADTAREEEVQEIDLLERAIDAGQKELAQQKVDYRALNESAPERTRAGLELMRARLQLELRKRELAWRRANRGALEEQVDHLEVLIESAARRLTATAQAIETAEEARQEAVRRSEELSLKVLQAQLSQSGGLALSPTEQARERLAEQELVNLEVRAAQQDVIAAQNGMVLRVLQRIRDGNEQAARQDRDFLRDYIDSLADIQDQISEWRRATARSRETALARIPDEASGPVVELLRERTETADASDRNLRALEEQLIGAVQFGDLLDSLLARREGKVAKGIQFAESFAEFSWERALGLANTSLFEISGAPVTSSDILRMLLILTIAWWVSKLLTRTLQQIADKRQTVNTGSIYTLTRILHYVILSVGIIIALSSIGIDFTKFALFASALGVGIGFGLQTLASNFVAGLIILFEKSLKVSDFVELESGVTGEVREINMRSTLVTTNDNIDIVVPNSEFVNGRVTNWTMREAYRRVHIPFGVAYGTDKELVKKAALEAAENVPETLNSQSRRKPQLWFVEFGDSSLNFELVVWLKPEAVKRPGAVHAMYLWEIDNKLREYDIEVPFPQRDLHLRSVLGKQTMEELQLGNAGKQQD